MERRHSWALGFSRPPAKRLWTRNQTGASHTEAVRRKLSVGREVKTEIPADWMKCSRRLLALLTIPCLAEGRDGG
jgi:hypothetical protein